MAHILFFFSLVSAVVLGFVGYVMNIVSLINGASMMESVELIIRIGGVVIPIVGAVAGWV